MHHLLYVALAVIGLALASQAEIPLRPVPITLQTLAVVLAGFLLGPIIGCIATALWLALGAAGLPLFAGGESGLGHFTGPTGGYLLSFPFAAALAGYLGKPPILRFFLAAVAAQLLTLVAGGGWLATRIGVDAAVEHGVVPFLPGALLKAAVAALVMRLVLAWRR